MSSAYVYRKPVRRPRYAEFRRRLIITFIIIAAFVGVGAYIYFGLNKGGDIKATSAVEDTEITGNAQTYTNDYFEFRDSGSWVIDKNNSNAQKLTYHKFRKSVIEAEMIVYINQDPIPLYSAAPRALPIRVVNDNSFDVTNVSSPCVNEYAKGELHKVKEVSINGAMMLCDPGSPQYFVILSEINGDYHIHLKRANGTPIEFVITYKDLGLDPVPNTIINVASSFQTR